MATNFYECSQCNFWESSNRSLSLCPRCQTILIKTVDETFEPDQEVETDEDTST